MTLPLKTPWARLGTPGGAKDEDPQRLHLGAESQDYPRGNGLCKAWSVRSRGWDGGCRAGALSPECAWWELHWGGGALQARNSGSWGGGSVLHCLLLQVGEAWAPAAVLGLRSRSWCSPRGTCEGEGTSRNHPLSQFLAPPLLMEPSLHRRPSRVAPISQRRIGAQRGAGYAGR